MSTVNRTEYLPKPDPNQHGKKARKAERIDRNFELVSSALLLLLYAVIGGAVGAIVQGILTAPIR